MEYNNFSFFINILRFSMFRVSFIHHFNGGIGNYLKVYFDASRE